MDKSWKQFERRASRDMGVERQPVTGERNGADNAPHPMFCFQFKLRRMIPAWLFGWLSGIAATAARDGKIGVLVLKLPRIDDGNAVVVLRWRDWVDLHGPTSFGSGSHRHAVSKTSLVAAALSPVKAKKTDTSAATGSVRHKRCILTRAEGL